MQIRNKTKVSSIYASPLTLLPHSYPPPDALPPGDILVLNVENMNELFDTEFHTAFSGQ